MSTSNSYETVSIPLPDGVSRELLVQNPQYTVTRMHLSKGVKSPQHQHPHAQVVYMLSGRGVFGIGDRAIELNAGNCVSVEPNDPHGFQPTDEEIMFLEFFVPGRGDIR